MRDSAVAVTGMGIISSIGYNTEENFQSLIKKSAGITTIENIKTLHKNHIKVGEIKSTNEELIKILGLPETNNYSRTALLAEIAVKEAVKNSGIKDMGEFKTGLISATSVGGMDMTEKYFNAYDQIENRKYIESHPIADSTTKIANSLGINDFVTSISTACSSSANAIMMGARMIKAGKLDRVIVGGADCLSKFTINGFKTLMILSEKKCMPFDQNRTGLNLGEAAAFLVLESDKIIQQKNKKVLAYLTGYANANDAFHQTASSENGEGAKLAMNKALKVASLTKEHIDYINAHGTATENNDNSESKAIIRIFGEDIPPFSSTKAFTGHTLAAAAAIEAVYAIMSLQNNLIFPNLNFGEAMEETRLIPETELIEKNVNHVLSNSFGFGGNCSTLIFSKY